MLRSSFVIALTLSAILAAGWLALRRGDIPYDTLEAAYSVPASQFMTLDEGLKIHFTDTGPREAQTIILVHGFSASLHTWTEWKVDLEQDYRVVTLDLPGHGLSRTELPEQARIERFAEIVYEVAKKLDIAEFTLAGNSMGGNTAWVYALTYPETLDGLILVDASGWPDEDEDRSSRPLIFRILANRFARTLVKDLDMTALTRDGLLDSYADQSYVTEALVERYVSLSRAPGHRSTLLAIMSQHREPADPKALQGLSVPTLILWGEEDNLVPVADADKFAQSLPDARKVIYPNIGHLPQEEAAAESVADVRAFLKIVADGSQLTLLDEVEEISDTSSDASAPAQVSGE